MKIPGILLIAGCAMIPGGCAVLPLPQDTSGSTTDEIVANVRCQARRAVRRAFRRAMHAFGDNIVASISIDGRSRTYTGREINQSIDDSELNYKDLKINHFIGIAKKPMNYYSTTQVAYQFTLGATEKNTQGVA